MLLSLPLIWVYQRYYQCLLGEDCVNVTLIHCDVSIAAQPHWHMYVARVTTSKIKPIALPPSQDRHTASHEKRDARLRDCCGADVTSSNQLTAGNIRCNCQTSVTVK